MDRACVIGAGSSGVAACQALHARSIPFDCYEAGSAVGGNWRYDNDNGMSAAYRSLRTKSSRRGMQYAKFPMPRGYPDYLGHEMVAAYLDDFVDHFGFRGNIQFQTDVTGIEPTGSGWDVTTRQRATGAVRTRRYQAVLVASGHHWDPKYPDPLPGAATFTGEQIHSHDYRTPEPFAGKRILIVGLGNSACDAATEVSQVAARTVVTMRRGTHVVPKYLLGRPTDYLTLSRLCSRAPLRLQQTALALLLRLAQGRVARYGLPEPDHAVLRAAPAVSDSLLSEIAAGAIVVKPGIIRLEAGRVLFSDGSVEDIDTVICCTGYKISFPFLGEAITGPEGRLIGLYHRVVAPRLSGLYFIGLVQPIGAIMPLAELQADWVADLIEGRAALPPQAEMDGEIDRYRAATAKRYARPDQPDIHVDFLAYVREIRRERRVGARRAGQASRPIWRTRKAAKSPFARRLIDMGRAG